jgi:hypothetical protein
VTTLTESLFEGFNTLFLYSIRKENSDLDFDSLIKIPDKTTFSPFQLIAVIFFKLFSSLNRIK